MWLFPVKQKIINRKYCNIPTQIKPSQGYARHSSIVFVILYRGSYMSEYIIPITIEPHYKPHRKNFWKIRGFHFDNNHSWTQISFKKEETLLSGTCRKRYRQNNHPLWSCHTRHIWYASREFTSSAKNPIIAIRYTQIVAKAVK